MKLSNIKVSTKLIGGFVIVALISVVIGFFGIINMSKINDSAEKMYEKELLGVSHIKDTAIELLYVAREWRSAMLTSDPADRLVRLDSAKNHLKKMDVAIHKAGQLFYTEEGKAGVVKLGEAHRDWKISIEKLMGLIPKENVAQLSPEFEELQEVASAQLTLVEEVLHMLSQTKTDNAEHASKDIENLYQFSRNVMLFVIGFGLLLGIGLGYRISKAITQPLSHAVMIANKLSAGDTSSNVAISGTDEVGQLLSAMSSMLESLKISFFEVNQMVDAAAAGNFKVRISTEGKNGFFLKLAEGLNSLVQTSDKGLNEVARVLGAIAKGDLTEKIDGEYLGTFGELKNYCNDTTDSLTTMLDDIRIAAETIYTASSEIATGNADLSSRTEQQAANLEETASSMEELTSTVKLNADNAKRANTLAEQASMVASDGGSLIQQVVTTMNEINQSSQKIADIIGVIDGIAFQTNILALNAAVEAARAGDQGRGFAVVASEVRTLAQRSANAAKDIKGLISDSVHKIEGGNALVSKSGDTMKEIVTAIKRVNDIMAEIAAASAEQSAGIEEVSTAVSQMDEMTQQNAALVEEAAAAAESLQSQADQLNHSVSQFKLSNEEKSGFTANRLSSPKTKITKKLGADKSTTNKKLSPPGAQQDDEWEQF